MSSGMTLFSEMDLSDELGTRQSRISTAVDAIPKEQFLISSDSELIKYIKADLTVDPLVLDEQAATVIETETKVDISGDPNRIFRSFNEGAYYVPGTCIDVDIPFSGEDWIFSCRTNPWFSVYPHGTVSLKSLRVSITLPHDVDRVKFKEDYDREMKLIRRYIANSSTQVLEYNESLPGLIQQAIESRRERLNKHGNIAALLDIPLATKLGAPSITPIRVEMRRPPTLPVPPKGGVKPEPGISGETFEHILQFIRHQGRTFETTPKTYAKHDEEDLRNIIMAQLNGHFKGDAGAEVFRKQGKTDLRIEAENRAAFVSECKVWTGPASLTGAMDQLLDYLTWRDSKAALVMFNMRNKDLSRIVDSVPNTLMSHTLFVQDIGCDEIGEWRIRMRSREDEGRRVIVHVFVFDLYHDPDT